MSLNATIIGQTIAFIFFVFFCMKYVWPPLIAAIEKRQKEIADSFASIERAKKDLDIAQAEAINHLKQAKVKAQAIIEQANKHKIQIVNKAKDEAEVARNNIFAQAQREIDAERKRVCEELYTQTAMLALACAEKIIECSISKTTNNDIIDKIIAEL